MAGGFDNLNKVELRTTNVYIALIGPIFMLNIIYLGEFCMKKKSIWITILVVVLVIAAIVGTIFYRRDSNGKPFKASLNREKVMMTPDWNATIKLKANKGATYRVLNNDKKVVQGKHKTINGKANIVLTKTGDYTVVAKSDNGHVSKRLPVKVTHYKANIGKWTNAVGPMKFKIISVDYQELTKNKKNQPDDSLVDEAYKQLNKHYYQIKVNYLVQNSGKKAVDPEYTMWNPESDDGQEFSVQSPTPEGIASDTIVGTSAITPGSGRAGSVTMISNNKFTVKHMKFSIGEVLGNDGNHVGKGGIAKIK